MESDVKNFNHHMWYREEDGLITIGINEEGLADITEITSLDLPAENESVAEDVAIGTIETDDGPLDIYSPVEGKVVEINSSVIEDPSLIQEDPYEEGWLIRIEATADLDDEDEDEDDFDEDEEDEEEEDED
ncbi:MAG: glycine cleavage system protein H [Bdellovibrio sp.]|nr:glycine cleavage system protein H [Bdellovibrio sp.]